MRQYKQKARFEAKANLLLEKSTKGKFLANASLNDLKSILPTDADEYPDLLAIAGNACVINMGNGNGDMMDTDVAVHIFRQFAHKPINIEHDRQYIVGHLTNSALTKYDAKYKLGAGSTILTPDDVKGSYDPFNIAVGGYIYRAMHEAVASKVLETNDPDSPEFLSVAFSWELAFDEHKLYVGSPWRNGEGELITDPDKLEAYGSYLKNNKGSGLLPDGRELYRLVSFAKLEDGQTDLDSVLAMGVALTLAPAGAVAGVVTHLVPEINEAVASLQENPTKTENTTEIISQTSVANVTTDTTITMKVLKDLKDLKSLNDETAKEYSFANIQHVVEAGEQTIKQQLEAKMTEASQQWASEKAEKEQAVASAQKSAQEALAKVAQFEAELKAEQDKVVALQAAQQVAEASVKFNERMAYFDENFDLSNEKARKAVASRLKGADDETFEKVIKEELSAFLSPKTAQTAVASTATDEDAKKAAAEALAKTQSAQASLPNTTHTDKNGFEKYAAAFKFGEGVTFETKNK